MMTTKKRMAISLVAGACALTLGAGALLLTEHETAYADETYVAFIDVGANSNADIEDQTLGLTETAHAFSATVPGTVTEGDTFFGGYSENATYTVSLDEGTWQVAVGVRVEAGVSVKVNGQSVSVPGEGKNAVVSAEVSGSQVTVEVTGKLCGVLVAPAESKTLVAVEYTPGQVLPYGAPLSEVLEPATAHFSDGSSEARAIEYGDIAASTGIDVNFTTVETTGVVEGTELVVHRYLTTMPDDLIYFINCGSTLEPDTVYPDGSIDDCYSYNQTIFDYYGDALINKVPDRSTSRGGDWGIYTTHGHGAPADASFPYNTYVWTGNDYGEHTMGYMLSGLTAGENYRIWFGTLSHWHARTVNITFNGSVVGSDTLRIEAKKGYSIFENVQPDANGKIDINMTQVGDQNEPTICFIAVQRMSTEIPDAPAQPQGDTIVGLDATEWTFTGAQEGAKIQLYNAAKPNQLIVEEKIDPEKIGSDGSYTIAWEGEMPVSQFCAVQVNKGGMSPATVISVTDIRNFAAAPESDDYTTSSVKVLVQAEAASGIVGWSYKLGEYGEVHEFTVTKQFRLNASFDAEENGEYIIVVTSGMGVTYSGSVEVTTIDRESPVIVLTPSPEGWQEGKYGVRIEVRAVAPVAEYTLYKGGVVVTSADTAPSRITLEEAGEYVVSVKTQAGQSSVASVSVTAQPTVTLVERSLVTRGTMNIRFKDTADFKIASVTAYEITDGSASRMTISSDKSMDVYNAGTYVVTVTTDKGFVEMFSLRVVDSELGTASPKSEGGLSPSAALGIGIGVGVGGVVLAASAFVVTFLLRRKKL